MTAKNAKGRQGSWFAWRSWRPWRFNLRLCDGQVTLEYHDASMDTESISRAVIGAAMDVHSILGPGLLESTYRACLAHELVLRGLDVQVEYPLPVKYKGLAISVGYRIDVLVEGILIVELKAVERILRVHEAQLLAYLKLSGLEVGLLMNFHVPRLRLGIRRMVNNYRDAQLTVMSSQERR